MRVYAKVVQFMLGHIGYECNEYQYCEMKRTLANPIKVRGIYESHYSRLISLCHAVCMHCM